ncbi:M48 family metallopeptidase [Hamadaea tsunoensis]|uniref:M48 family metallopeptidase n=1 Tax=Hamadaea tsunoensis TaxID=53368 RepID=UPI0003F53CAC|nr:M48 family metallopeptidase [Hamadaea tsunoensis]
MVARLRALASLVMLAGFFVFALVLLGLGVFVGIWAAMHAHALIKLALILIIGVGGAIIVGAKQALFFKPTEPDGVLVDAYRAPELWHEVRTLAQAAGTRPPDDIRIIPEVNAAVSEDSQLLGLIGGRRHLYIGMPLLLSLNVSQFRAVIGHELGHYSNAHTRLGAIAFRGRLAIGGALGHLGGSLISWPFCAYGRLYLLVDNAASRMQEREADQIAVRVAGTRATTTALAELPVIEAAWGFYFSRYVGPTAEAGFLPRDLFRGFYEMSAARQGELGALRSNPPHEDKSVWDTHPPITERVRRIGQLPPVVLHEDTRLSATLIPALDQLGETLQSAVVASGRQVSGDWNELTNVANTARVQEAADDIFRQAARALGVRQAGLTDVLYAIEAGRGAQLAAGFPGATLPQLLQPLLTLAAVRSGAASWRHSWTSMGDLVTAQGQPLDIAPLAALAADSLTIAQAKAQLAALGVRVDEARVVEAAATAKKAEIIGGIANTKVNGAESDVLILDNGLILVNGAGKSDDGKNRLIRLLQSAPVADLAQRNYFLPFEVVTAVEIEKPVPLRATLVLHDGNRIELKEAWSAELLHKQSRDVLLEILNQVNARRLPTA